MRIVSHPTLDIANIVVAICLIVTIIVSYEEQQQALDKQQMALLQQQKAVELAQQQLNSTEMIRVAQIRPWVGRVHYSLELQIVTFNNGSTMRAEDFSKLYEKYGIFGGPDFNNPALPPSQLIDEIERMDIKELDIRVAFHNYGALPALNLISRTNITLDSIPTLDPDPHRESVPSANKRLLLPNDDIIMHAYVPFDKYDSTLRAEHKLYIIFRGDYEYPGNGQGWTVYVARIHPNITHSHISSGAG